MITLSYLYLVIVFSENFENHYLGKSEKSTPSWLEKSSIRKGPLQETSQNLTGSMSGDLSDSQSSLKDERKSSLSEGRTRRLSSGSTDSDSGKTKDRRSSKKILLPRLNMMTSEDNNDNILELRKSKFNKRVIILSLSNLNLYPIFNIHPQYNTHQVVVVRGVYCGQVLLEDF